MANRGPIIYSSDAGLNKSLGNLAGVLGQALAVYNQPKELEKPFSVFETRKKLKESGMSNQDLDLIPLEQYAEINRRAESYLPTLGRDQAFIYARDQVLNGINPEQSQGSQLQQILNQSKDASSQQVKNAFDDSKKIEQDNSFFGSLKSALTGNAYSNLGAPSTDQSDSFLRAGKKGIESSAAGKITAITNQEGYEAFKEKTKLKGPTWAKKMTYDLSNLLADAPLLASGGILGSVAGPIGAGAGALALPAAVNKSLDEYLKYIDKGGKASFGDYLQSFANVADATIYGAAEGGLMALLGGIKVPFDKIPGLQNILKIKGSGPAKELINTATQAGIFTTAVNASKGEFPSLEDYGNNVSMFLGFKLFQEGSGAFKGAYEKLKSANIEPQHASLLLKEKIAEKGYDPKKPADMVRAIEDITKLPSKSKEVFTEKINATKQEPISIKQTAESLAERPIDKYIEGQEKKEFDRSKPLTARETLKREVAKESAKDLKKEVQVLENKLDAINDRLEIKGLTKSLVEFNEKAKVDVQNELFEKNRMLKEANDIATKGKIIQSQETITKEAQERLERLIEDVKNPTSDSAIKTQEDFLRDQKYVNDYLELIEKGKIPISKQSDFYINTLETYQDAYRRKISEVNEKLKSADKNERQMLEKYKHLLESNVSINNSKINLQKDKLSSLEQIKGAKGALVKQRLKNLRPDIQSLQKDFVKVSKLEQAIEKTTQNVSQEVLNSIEKGNIEETSKLTNTSKEKIKEISAEAAKIESDFITEVKEGNISEALKNKIKSYFSKYSGMQNSLAKGFLLTGIKNAIKGKYGINIPQSLVNKGFTTGAGGSIYAIFRLIQSLYNFTDNRLQARKLRNAKTTAEKQIVVRELKSKGYKPATIKKIIANANN